MRARISSLGLLLLALAASAVPASAQSWKTVSKSRQLRSQDFLDVKIEYAVGRLEVGRGSDRLLYRVESRFDEDVFSLNSTYLESGGRGNLSIELDGHDDVDLQDLKDYDYEAGNLRIDLSPATPLALSLKFGAAEARLDLGGLRMRKLVLETGASDTEVEFNEPNPEVAEFCSFKAAAAAFKVRGLGNSRCQNVTVSGGVGDVKLDFSGEWSQDANADINVGLGGIEIRVPPEIGVRIERSTFLMSFDA
ncbi:MAG: hypothetical protein JSU87_15185, partial [Gemmatimonadota bacterium]